MIRQRRTREGETIPHHLYDMETTHLRNGQLFFPRPNVVEHIIDSRSPLFGIQRATLTSEPFEIIAIIEGSFDYTGFSCHFRTSYLPHELLWGYQFSSCNSTLGGFDFEKFNQVHLVDARPVWNYDGDETDSNSPTTPTVAFPMQFPPLNQPDKYTRLKPNSESHAVAAKPTRLETIDSFTDASPNDSMILRDADEEHDASGRSLLSVERIEFE